MPIMSVFAPLPKSRFYGFYDNGITFADGMGGIFVNAPYQLQFSACRGILHQESEGFGMMKILFVCHGSAHKPVVFPCKVAHFRPF